MEFDPSASIDRILETFGSKHNLSRVSIWLPKKKEAPEPQDEQQPENNQQHQNRLKTTTNEKGLIYFVVEWFWCSSSSNPLLRGQSITITHDDNCFISKHKVSYSNNHHHHNNNSNNQINNYNNNNNNIKENAHEERKTDIELVTTSICTPLLSHRDNSLLGLLITERVYKKKITVTLKEEQEEENSLRQLRSTLPVLTELLGAILVDSHRWGHVSQPDLQLSINLDDTLRQFMELFEVLRKKPKHDRWEEKGREKFEEQVVSFMKAKLPIAMVLPSFPFKSSNTRQKVISRNADMAEKLALDALKEFCARVRKFYPPGVALIIVSDGRVYCSQFGIELPYVLSFQRQVREMNESPDITFAGLGDFLPVTSEATKRDALLTLFGQNMDKIADLLKQDADFHRVYCGFKKFMAEELNFPAGSSVKQKRDKCASAAREMMKSNDAYGRLVDCLFPQHVRLSIHAHSNVDKVGITMVKMTEGLDMQWGTPWHNCALLRQSGAWELIRKNVAIQRGYELRSTENGLPYYYEPASQKKIVEEQQV